MDSYCIECPMVRPPNLSSSQFSEAFLVMTRPCLLKIKSCLQSSCVQSVHSIANYHCVPLFMKLLYDHLYLPVLYYKSDSAEGLAPAVFINGW